MGRLVGRLIPKIALNARSHTITYDDYNYPSETTTNFQIFDCTVHPMKSYEQQSLPEGYRDSKSYKIITRTKTIPIIEGRDVKFQVKVPEGFWCDVISSNVWQIGIQPHYEIIVSHTNER